MKLLLDTHAFLWFVLDDSRLSESARTLMMDRGNELLISPASYWELAIKISLGKYQLDEDFETFMAQQIASNDLVVLPLTVSHAAAVSKLPFIHRDPFDRLLVAQAKVEDVPILSADEVLDGYAIRRVW